MLTVLIILAGFYAFTRGCWVGGSCLFYWVAAVLILILAAATI